MRSSTGRSAANSRGRCAAAMPTGTPISVEKSAETMTSESVSSVAAQ